MAQEEVPTSPCAILFSRGEILITSIQKNIIRATLRSLESPL
jgi:hypothetical protein